MQDTLQSAEITEDQLNLDPEDLIEELQDDEYVDPTPADYIAIVTGIKGGGKGLTLCRLIVRACLLGIPVWTNIFFFREALLALGVKEKNLPKPLDMDFILSFDKSLHQGIVVFDEIDTSLNRLRSTNNQAIMVTRFLTQLRKRYLKVFLALHFFHLLPADIREEADLLINCHDSFYTQFGKENQIPRGKMVFQTYTDKSGVFTGMPGYTINATLGHCENLWHLYDSYQTIDPFGYATKYHFTGGDKYVDVSGKNRGSLSEMWEKPLMSFIISNLKNCGAKLEQKGVHSWLSWSPKKVERIASTDEMYDEYMETMEQVMDMKTQSFVRCTQGARAKMSIQILPELVPELTGIFEGNN